MRKFGFVATAGLIAAAFGGWISTATTARVAPFVNGGGIDTYPDDGKLTESA